MEIKLNVEIGATKELTAILKGLVSLLPKNDLGELPKQSFEALAEIHGEKDTPPTETEKQAEEPKETPKEAPKAPSLPSSEDYRKAMNLKRAEFEGEDWKDNTDSEAYKKYHKPLTNWFKYLANLHGAADSKPSSLTADQRASFIADVEKTILGEDGNFVVGPSAVLEKEA